MVRWFAALMVVLAAPAALGASPAAAEGPNSTATPAATATSTATPNPSSATPPSATSSVSPEPAAAPVRDLPTALARIVESSALRGTRTGVLVERVDTGEVLYAKDPDALLNPASNTKLFTSAAALARLGPEFRFETEFWVDGGPGARTLHVRGKGDPTIVTERLYAIAGELKHAGLRAVREIVVDESWFDGEREGVGYDQERGDRSYLAPTGAVALNYDAIEIHVAPGDRPGARARVEVDPESDFVVVENRTTTGKPGSRRRLAFHSALVKGRQHIRVEGRVPAGSLPQVAWRRVDDPPAYLAWTLRQLLDERGVKVSGGVRLGPVPPSARLLHVSESESLGEIVRRLNKHSNNFTAEQLVKALGAQVKGPPGSWPKGIAAVEEFLAEAGIPRGSFTMRNGSGLNDANRFTARQHVTLLREMWRRFPLMAEFLASLPVAGKDGTIRRRMGDAAGMLRAKTGTLEDVTSLCGFAETATGERLAFAVLVNDTGSRRGVVRAVDAIGGALAASGRPSELGAAVAAATAPPSPAASSGGEPVVALRARLAVFDDLARTGGARSASLLEAALRGADDPAERMAAAEAIYRAAPSAEGSRRMLLDNLALDDATLARLAEAGPRPASDRRELPVLGSLAELAAEGNAEAAARLVEAAPASTGEPARTAAYGALVAEVAAGAGETLLTALRAAPAPTRDAAVGALAFALAAGPGEEGEAPNPFPALVAKAGDGAGEAGAFARDLAAKLAERTATEQALRHAKPADAIGPAPSPASTSGPAPKPAEARSSSTP